MDHSVKTIMILLGVGVVDRVSGVDVILELSLPMVVRSSFYANICIICSLARNVINLNK